MKPATDLTGVHREELAEHVRVVILLDFMMTTSDLLSQRLNSKARLLLSKGM